MFETFFSHSRSRTILETKYQRWNYSPFSRNLSQVEYLVDKYGLEIFKERDEYGHSPAHWMALNGHASIARYMATKCGALDLHSDNSQGPRPIHWASRNGHVAVVDILLSAGKVWFIKIRSNLTLSLWLYFYRISSYSFRRNYSFLNLEIAGNSNSCRNISIFCLINWIFDPETIQGLKIW